MSFACSPVSFLSAPASHGDLLMTTAFCIPPPPRSSAGRLLLSRPAVTSLRCNAISKPRSEGYTDVIQNDLAVTVKDEKEKDPLKEESDKIRELAVTIRSMLQSMGDGEITVSPYDTAWVALVEDVSGGERRPQFPSSLEWISNNQLSDGSWGDPVTFTVCDRIMNTLACVVALKAWNLHPEKFDKGISFIKENINRIDEENEEHMPIGFEVALPSLIDIAKKLEIDIPTDTKGLRDIYARREIKLKKIPMEVVHQVPTTLLHSLEGMGGLIWDKLLKLQSEDGSFLFSPSSTAFALQQTKDEKCLQYLTKHVQKFNGGVPNVYPVDLFEHIWAVDRLQRLGLSRYFQPEFDECIAYIHWYWTEKGICWARNSEVQDIDDTAMGFRLMRLHGYEVSADVFKHFKSGEEFFCFKGQSTQAVTGMYNLYRASQLAFPGENILAEAADFSTNFLKQKRAKNELLDKWIIMKDLPGEVGYALDVPYYANLPRIETRFYLEQYGGEDDVWIGKTLYRMPYINNNKYLELAKLDYNNCQELHLQEWIDIQKWYQSCSFGEFGLSERRVLEAYYVAAASIFEPERSQERLAWVKTTLLMETITLYFHHHQLSEDQKHAFIDEFQRDNILGHERYTVQKSLVGTVLVTLNQLTSNILLAHACDIHQPLKNAWQKWLKTLGDRCGDADLLVQTLNLTGGGCRRRPYDDLLSHPKYDQLSKLTVSVCDKLRLFQNGKVQDGNGGVNNARVITTLDIESKMQEIVKLVVMKDDLDSEMKKNFFTIARSFYYAAFFNPGTIDSHIAKVLFERFVFYFPDQLLFLCNAMNSPNLVQMEEEESDNYKIRELAGTIRSMLQSMGDGKITVSPYDIT